MNIIFSNTTYDEVRAERNKAFLPLKGSLKESCVSLLKRMPFFFIWLGIILFWVLLMIKKGYSTISKYSYIYESNELNIFLTLFFTVIIGIVIIHIFTKTYYYLLNKIFPISTPIVEQEIRNHHFYSNTKHIEETLEFQYNLQLSMREYDSPDIKISINKNKIKLEIKNKCSHIYNEYEYNIDENEKKKLVTDKGLDFSYIDLEWEQQKQLIELNS